MCELLPQIGGCSTDRNPVNCWEFTQLTPCLFDPALTNPRASAILFLMFRKDALLYAKVTPPRPTRRMWTRPRLATLLLEALDYRVTLVHAGTGYGKSTALAGLAQVHQPIFWYSVGVEDSDPQQFLAYLIETFRFQLDHLTETPLALLQEVGNLQGSVTALLNVLQEQLMSPTLLVIDDYHFAMSPRVDTLLEHFLNFMPPRLHIILSTRYVPVWNSLLTWRVRGEVLDIKRETLAFTQQEIGDLFKSHGMELAPKTIEALADKTEGWGIALQLIWQQLRVDPTRDVNTLFRPDSAAQDLFTYLARDVLAQQPPELQRFMLQTAVLRELNAEVCNAVTERANSSVRLAQALERDLFLVQLGKEAYRYHHLFHDFLRETALAQDSAAVRACHVRAGEYYQDTHEIEEAIYHFLRAESFDQAAERIEEIGDAVLHSGRLDTLNAWIHEIPSTEVLRKPALLFYLGELARLHSRFDEALVWYKQAEQAWRGEKQIGGVARALHGQALVYLDTVRPSEAEGVLQEALRLNDGLDDSSFPFGKPASARVLELLAENKLNLGKAQEAEELRAEARALREDAPSEDVLGVRVKIRTGELDKARAALERWSDSERGQLHPPRAHRETLLLLSLVYAMQGRAIDALAMAQEGIALGTQLGSPFVTAVGHMRLGHAHLLLGDLNAALENYRAAVTLGDELAVRRTRAEACWGMTRAHGFGGDLAAARRVAEEGIEIAGTAGDAWVVAQIRLALGASLVRAREADAAIVVLDEALAGFRACADGFGSVAARLWLAAAHWQLRQRERALAHLDNALALGQEHRYNYLFTTPTFLGWQDARRGVPLLLEAMRRGQSSAYARALLREMELDGVTIHPGYQLRIQTFGAFRVWRGDHEISLSEWQRRKARQFLQLFVTFRGRVLQRDEILEFLYPGEAPDTSANDFKVALSAYPNNPEARKAIKPHAK